MKSDEELLKEAEALEAQYAEAAAFDARHEEEKPEEYWDEMDELRKAGLNMGRP